MNDWRKIRNLIYLW